MSGKLNRIKEISLASFKLGSIGFGGIAGVISTIENEIVIRRKWIDNQHFLDIVSTSNIIPGPNAVEIIMHCGKERGGKTGLVVAGICYILPATIITLFLAFLYGKYGQLPVIQDLLYGMRPAITAIVLGTVVRLSQSTLKSKFIILIASLVLIGSLININELILIFCAGLLTWLSVYREKLFLSASPMQLLLPCMINPLSSFSESKLFLIFLKIGSILYGSGYVLFAYMNDALVERNQWLTKQQLLDSIAIGQVTPGPILSSVTFAGYLIDGTSDAMIATVGVFLPSFIISLIATYLLSNSRKNTSLRPFLDGLAAASIALIASVGIQMLSESFLNRKTIFILILSFLLMMFFKKMNTVYIILFGSITGYILLGI